MQTEVFSTERGEPSDADWTRIGRLLRRGGLVVFPTETVYGIAVAADQPEAVERLYCLKSRPADSPLAYLLASPAHTRLHAAPCFRTRRLIRRLWPGPLTLVVPGHKGAFVGLRAPDHPAAVRLVREAGCQILATSANPSGQAPATDPETAAAYFSGAVEALISAGDTKLRSASTVVRVSASGLELLREGHIPFDTVRMAAAYTVMFVCTGNLCRSPMAEGILKALVAERLGVGLPDVLDHGIRIISAGTAGIVDEPATIHAVEAAGGWGADIGDHLSRALTPTLVQHSCRILAATRRHTRRVLEMWPEAESKTRLILPGNEDLDDPFGQILAVYRLTAMRIREALVGYADALVSRLAAGRGDQ